MRVALRPTVGAALVAGALLTAGIYSQSGGPPEPPAIAGQGYEVTFQDEFNDLNTTVWTDHAYRSTPDPGAVYTNNGVLELHSFAADRPAGEPHQVHLQTGPPRFGDPVRFSFQFGYAEARMRFTGGQGSWPAFWLSSVAHATHEDWLSCPEPDLNFELDIMEWLGAEPTTFYGTLHRNTNGLCSVPDETSGGTATMGSSLAGGWHTYAVLWTATSVKWYVDDQLVLTENSVFDSQDQSMYLILSMQACGWDPPNGCNGSTPADLVTEVDWVRVWELP